MYFCIDPDCNYKVDTALALGKRTRCNICDSEFLMNEYTIKLAKPHCHKCGKIKIKDDNGQARFINKGRSVAAIAEDMAAKPVQSLRERLSSVVTMEKDEDI